MLMLMLPLVLMETECTVAFENLSLFTLGTNLFEY